MSLLPLSHVFTHVKEQLDDWKIYIRDTEQLTGDVQVLEAWDFGLHP